MTGSSPRDYRRMRSHAALPRQDVRAAVNFAEWP
jgi:hypothetical protein